MLRILLHCVPDIVRMNINKVNKMERIKWEQPLDNTTHTHNLHSVRMPQDTSLTMNRQIIHVIAERLHYKMLDQLLYIADIAARQVE